MPYRPEKSRGQLLFGRVVARETVEDAMEEMSRERKHKPVRCTYIEHVGHETRRKILFRGEKPVETETTLLASVLA
jgi:hypothetical protein